MNKKYNFLLAFCLIILSNCAAQDKQKFDALVQEAIEKDVFSGNILIAQNGQITYQKSTGFADIPNKIANTDDTRFALASITKFFTKTIILQLVEQKKLNLSDNLGKYLTGFSPEIAESVTIDHLMQHRSGLGSYDNVPDFRPMQINQISDFLKFIQQEKLAFKAGSQSKYSNSGYVVLANIIEKITGKSYAEVLKMQILDKIGMKDTYFSQKNADDKNKAKGYLSNESGPKKDNTGFAMPGGGDGGIVSTTNDMWKFAQSLTNDNKLLSDESKVKLFNIMNNNYQTWQEFLTKGKMMIAGGAPGISAVWGMNMEEKYFVTALSNYDEGSAEQVAKRLTAILNGTQPEPFEGNGEKPADKIYAFLKNNDGKDFGKIYKEIYQKSGVPLDNDMILLFAGQRLLEEKQYDKAIILYETYTTDFPKIVVAWNDMGDAYLAKNNKEKAIFCYKKALEIRPSNPRAKENLEKLGVK